MKLKLINNNKNKLIIFLTGWGCDSNQFRYMKSKNYNVLIVYDYSDKNLNFDFSKYQEINLVAFSAGVLMSCVLKNKLPRLNKKIAFNGNPKNFDSYYGLSKELEEKFRSITHKTVVPFRREYMVFNEKELQLCNHYHSSRSIEDSNIEFNMLEKYCADEIDVMNFNLIMISDSDKIFTLQRQKEYFKNCNCKIIPNCAHYPFFKYDNFDKIMELV